VWEAPALLLHYRRGARRIRWSRLFLLFRRPLREHQPIINHPSPRSVDVDVGRHRYSMSQKEEEEDKEGIEIPNEDWEERRMAAEKKDDDDDDEVEDVDAVVRHTAPPPFDLFRETFSAFLESILAYFISDVRQYVRTVQTRAAKNNGKKSESSAAVAMMRHPELAEKLLEPPISTADVVKFFLANVDGGEGGEGAKVAGSVSGLREVMSRGDTGMYVSAIDIMIEEISRYLSLQTAAKAAAKSAAAAPTVTTNALASSQDMIEGDDDVDEIDCQRDQVQEVPSNIGSTSAADAASCTINATATGDNESTDDDDDKSQRRRQRGVRRRNCIRASFDRGFVREHFGLPTLREVEGEGRRQNNQQQKQQSNDEHPAFVGHTTVEVVDESNAASELVYTICVDRASMKIILSFRGTVTIRDWLTDVDSRMVKQKNPLWTKRGEKRSRLAEGVKASSQSTPQTDPQTPQGRYFAVHRGFYNYLLVASSLSATVKGKTKYESIHDHLKRLLVRFPGYRIRVTGHSMVRSSQPRFELFCLCHLVSQRNPRRVKHCRWRAMNYH